MPRPKFVRRLARTAAFRPRLESLEPRRVLAAVADVYTVAADASLDIPAPGLLRNDSVSGYALVSQSTAPGGGTVNVDEDGGFTFDPAGNFGSASAGVAQATTFTYTQSEFDIPTGVVFAPYGPNGTYNAYLFVGTGRTFDQARADAVTRTALGVAGHLAVPNSEAENAFLRSTFSGTLWIGLTDLTSTSTIDSFDYSTLGTAEFGNTSGFAYPPSGQTPADVTGTQRGEGWQPLTGEPLLFQNWGGSEPNDSSGESAAELRTDGFWNDLPAGSTAGESDAASRNYIVEFPLGAMLGLSGSDFAALSAVAAPTSQTTATVTINVVGTDAAPTAVNDTAMVSEDEVLNGSGLLNNDSDPDNQDVLAVVPGTVASNAGATVTLGGAGTYIYDPAAIYNGLGYGETATDTFTYGLVDIEPNTLPPLVFAPTGPGGTYNAYAYVQTARTFDAARADAETRSFLGVWGHLAVPNSQAENDVLRNSFSNATMWLGLTDLTTTSQIDGFDYSSLGTQEFGNTSGQQYPPNGNRGAGWQPVNGDALAFQNWAGAEPNNSSGESAAELRTDGLWNDLPAGSTAGERDGSNRPYIVEFELGLPSVAGLMVTGFQNTNYDTGAAVNNLADAEAIIANNTATATYDFISATVNFTDGGGTGARFVGDSVFPGVTGDDWVTESQGYVYIPTPGRYTFGVNSDDGFRLEIDGANLVSVSGSGTVNDGGDLVFSAPRGPSDSLGVFEFDEPGFFPIRNVFFERAGGATVDLFAAPGEFTGFDSSMRLVGDIANGGLAVVTNLPTTPDATATVTVTLVGENDQFTANPDVGTVSEDGPAVAIDVVANDTDPDATATRAVIDVDASGATGSVSFTPGAATVSYDPNGQFESLDLGDTASDSFTYTAVDVLLQDDFNDGVLDPAKWTTNLNIPQGGAQVNETGGVVELINRGHLVTAEQYDPVEMGGLVVAGEWTFVNVTDQDFIQILVRSDGQPAGGFGETNSGVELYWTTAGQPTFRNRGGALGVGNVVRTGSASVSQGDTFRFVLTDDGTGNLSFTATEVGNPSNTVSVTANVTSDTSNTNYVVFHNREAGGREAHLDNVVIGVGAPRTAAANVTINGQNDAPAPAVGGPYTLAEGGSITLDASATTDADADGSLTYSWDLNGDGTTDIGPTSSPTTVVDWATLVALGIDDDSQPTDPNGPPWTVTLTVQDDSGAMNDTATATTTLTVENAAPEASFVNPPTEGASGQPLTFVFEVTDASPIDQAAAFTFDIDWGDGQSDSVTTTLDANGQFIIEHTYQTLDTFNIVAEVADKDATPIDTVTHAVTTSPVLMIDGDLYVGGQDDVSDRITVVPSGDRIRVDFNRDRYYVDAGEFDPADLDIFVYGQSGDDLIRFFGRAPGEWRLHLFGGDGNDYLAGGQYDDLLDGGDGDDRLLAGDGNNTLFGGLGNDTLTANFGDDYYDAGWGNDILTDRGGNNILIGGPNEMPEGATGFDNDRMAAGDGEDLLIGGLGNDSLSGGRGNDILLGGEGNDRLLASTGNDILIGDAGRDSLIGDRGDDLLLDAATLLTDPASSDPADVDAYHQALLGAVVEWNAGALDVDATFAPTTDSDADVLYGLSGDDDIRGSFQDRIRD